MANNKISSVLSDLAVLLEAGIAPLDAIARLKSDKDAPAAPLERLHQELKLGRSFASAMSRSALASRLESAVLEAAEHSGKLSEALRFIADNTEARTARIRTLRFRLWLPNLVLFVALASQAVLTVSRHEADGILSGAALLAIALIALSQCLLHVLGCDAGVFLSLSWRLGLHANYKRVTQYFEHYFFTLFAWQAESGIDYVDATKTQNGLLDAAPYRKAVQRYRAQVARGGEVTSALKASGLAQSSGLVDALKTGEVSGRLAQSLRHYLTLSGQELEQSSEQIFTWLPRFYYCLIVVIAAATII